MAVYILASSRKSLCYYTKVVWKQIDTYDVPLDAFIAQ